MNVQGTSCVASSKACFHFFHARLQLPFWRKAITSALASLCEQDPPSNPLLPYYSYVQGVLLGFSLGQISAALQLCALFAGLWLRQPYVNVQVCSDRTHGQIPKNFVSRDLRRFVARLPPDPFAVTLLQQTANSKQQTANRSQ